MRKIIINVLVSILLLSDSLFGQGIKMRAPAAETVRAELTFMHPSFERTSDLSVFSGIYVFNLSVPVHKKFNILLGLPFSTWSSDAGDSEQAFGNLFIGTQTKSADTTGLIPSAVFGVHLPTASDDESSAAALAFITDFHEQHRYWPNTVTIILNGAWHNQVEKRGFYALELGARFLIPTDSGERSSEMILNYGASGGFNLDPVALSLELAGQFLLSSEADSFSDKFYHTLSFGGKWTRGPFRPMIFYSLYLEEWLSDSVNGVLGIRLTYFFD